MILKNLVSSAVVALALGGTVVPAFAQGYGGYGSYGGYETNRGYDSYERGNSYGRRDYDDRRDYQDRRDGGYRRSDEGYGRGGGYAFDAGEYLRCNPDVRRAIQRGQMSSAADHYRVFGRREGRRLSC